MPRIISGNELKRRKLIASAERELIEAIGTISEKYKFDLSYLEWLWILNQAMTMFLGDLLVDEWGEE